MACGNKHLSTNYIYTPDPFVFSSSLDVDSLWHELHSSSHRFCICFRTYKSRLSHFTFSVEAATQIYWQNRAELITTCLLRNLYRYLSKLKYIYLCNDQRLRGLKELNSVLKGHWPWNVNLCLFSISKVDFVNKLLTYPFVSTEYQHVRDASYQFVIVQCQKRSNNRSEHVNFRVIKVLFALLTASRQLPLSCSGQ